MLLYHYTRKAAFWLQAEEKKERGRVRVHAQRAIFGLHTVDFGAIFG